ncbi:phage-derived invertase/resolvase (plasmid) [Rhizobium rhizogenes K84]|uniref:Phage-derived invertase/resolvase n=1 Tax=Rhizobium rhizogenes (strain K84 / ATCC BAA-868) TaxID=311403 RepID=B9JQI9_RHIR8|nr:phage-derived invertase/resolvase [Rhizobium rhizogenes K84]
MIFGACSQPYQPFCSTYAQVSTEDQLNDAQVDELHVTGCHRIHQELGSGTSRTRPVVAKLLKELAADDVLVVARLDRLARSVSHLLISSRTSRSAACISAGCAIRSIHRRCRGSWLPESPSPIRICRCAILLPNWPRCMRDLRAEVGNSNRLLSGRRWTMLAAWD